MCPSMASSCPSMSRSPSRLPSPGTKPASKTEALVSVRGQNFPSKFPWHVDLEGVVAGEL